MKLNKKLLSFVLCFLVLFIYFDFPSYADVSDAKKAVYHEDIIADKPEWDLRTLNCYYTVTDSSDIPVGSLNEPYYFYTIDNITFQQVSARDLFTNTLNKGLGILFDSNSLSAFMSSAFSLISGVASPTGKISTALYSDNGGFLGYCLNDISGCYYSITPAFSSVVVVPDDFTDTMHGIYNKYLADNFAVPDYFILDVPSISETITLQSIASTEQYFNTLISLVNNGFSSPCSFLLRRQRSSNYYTFRVASTNGRITFYDELPYFVHSTYDGNGSVPNYSDWNTFCQQFGIRTGSVLNYRSLASGSAESFSIYSYLDGQPYSTSGLYNLSTGELSNSTYSTLTIGITGTYEATTFGEDITIFKDIVAYNDFINEDYMPSQFTSDKYNNYSPSNDNSFNTTTTQLSSSVTDNSTAYTYVSSEYYNNVDNGVIDNSAITNIVNNTINNYYPDTPDNPDNPDNPDDPDNPDNPDDNGIWDRFLNAIVTFFEKIGEILGAVLAGIVEMINAILEHIAGILEAISPFTEFLQAAFAWIPEPVPTVLAVGITICILAAVIKFIRG